MIVIIISLFSIINAHAQPALLLLPGHRSPFINKANGAGSDVATTDNNYC